MTGDASPYRSAAWLLPVVAGLLMVPLVAMHFTDQVVWGPGDFAIAGVLLFGTGLTYQWAARTAGARPYRAAAGVALGAALLLVWSNAAVGLIGDEGNPANLMYVGVLAVGVGGTAIARFRPQGMARAMYATAAAQALVAVIALVLRLGTPVTGPVEIVETNAFFVALFVGSAALFSRTAHETPEPDAA